MKSKRTCPKGHVYYKSSDCPTCPVCEKALKPEGPFAKLSAPARRALQHAGIKTLQQLANHDERSISKLHGIGPNSLVKLIHALKAAGRSFKK